MQRDRGRWASSFRSTALRKTSAIVAGGCSTRKVKPTASSRSDDSVGSASRISPRRIRSAASRGKPKSTITCAALSSSAAAPVRSPRSRSVPARIARPRLRIDPSLAPWKRTTRSGVSRTVHLGPVERRVDSYFRRFIHENSAVAQRASALRSPPRPHAGDLFRRRARLRQRSSASQRYRARRSARCWR